MSARPVIPDELCVPPLADSRVARVLALALVGLGLAALALGFWTGDSRQGWFSLYVATAVVMGLANFGPVLSAIFELTGAKWGRAYRRLAEGSVVLMPLGIMGVLALVAGGRRFLPWAHGEHLSGGKALWLLPAFWSARVLFALHLSYGVSLWFVYHSWRRDFCVAGVKEGFPGRLSAFLSKGITNAPAEVAHCSARLRTLAPIVAIVYALSFSLLGFDWIMSLEPDWISTLFGAWYFVSSLFSGLALLALVSLAVRRRFSLEPYLTRTRQADLATLLFAFCLLTTDFFWSQYLTIWYGNLPEETSYLISRVEDASLPWSGLSFAALAAFFFIPFLALLLRRIKHSGPLLATVAAVVLAGVFLARFVEIAPPLLGLAPGSKPAAALHPLGGALLTLLGLGGAGYLLYRRFLRALPLLPLADEVFLSTLHPDEEHRPDPMKELP